MSANCECSLRYTQHNTFFCRWNKDDFNKTKPGKMAEEKPDYPGIEIRRLIKQRTGQTNELDTPETQNIGGKLL